MDSTDNMDVVMYIMYIVYELSLWIVTIFDTENFKIIQMWPHNKVNIIGKTEFLPSKEGL